MRRLDSGVVPISENDRPRGHDLTAISPSAVLRKARGQRLRSRCDDSRVVYCFEDEDLDCVAENMAPEGAAPTVVDRNKRSSGWYRWQTSPAREARHTLEGVSERGRPYTT